MRRMKVRIKEAIVYTCSNEECSDGKIVDYTEECDSVKELFGTCITLHP
jgi:hypothetical protein